MKYALRRVRPRLLAAGVTVSLVSLTSSACAGSMRLVSTPTPQLEARVARDSLDAAAHVDLALARWSDGRYDDAEAELTEATVLDPQCADAYLALGYLAFARRPTLWSEVSNGRVPQAWKEPVRQAEAYRRRALLLDPRVNTAVLRAVAPELADAHTDPLVGRAIRSGFDEYNDGRYEASFAVLSDLVKSVSNRMAGHNRISWDSLPGLLFWYQGLAAAQTGRYEVAIQNMKRVLQRKESIRRDEDLRIVAPLNAAEVRYVTGVLQQKAGLEEAAEKSYRDALSEEPGLYLAHARLADLYESRLRLEDAVRERRLAASVDPDDPSLLVDLGRTLMRAGNAAEAVEPLRRAIAMQPRLPEAYHQLGRALVALHDPAARATLAHFIACAPSTMAAAVDSARQLLNRVASGL